MLPSELQTTSSHLEYPARWELMRWYSCWRKNPYATEVIAFLVADGRGEEWSNFPCKVDPDHWHVGRGHNQANPKKLLQRAKRVYRKSARDEVWRNHVAKMEETEDAP